MDLKKILNKPNTTIIDVRERLEFMMGHVKGAVNIPLGKVPSRLEEIREMDKPIVLYCMSGKIHRSPSTYELTLIFAKPAS